MGALRDTVRTLRRRRCQGGRAQGKRAKRKVRKEPKWIARAVLEALKRRDWKYAIHPDVAYPPVMLAQRKVGSCADSSIMFAAVMMALGLRPLLILIENHMMAGVWIRGRPYSRSTFDTQPSSRTQ